jgi:hypothetical protein
MTIVQTCYKKNKSHVSKGWVSLSQIRKAGCPSPKLAPRKKKTLGPGFLLIVKKIR